MERRNVEVKVRTTETVKREAQEVYARWGVTLNEAVNMFLAKSVEVGGLPFDLRPGVCEYASVRLEGEGSAEG